MVHALDTAGVPVCYAYWQGGAITLKQTTTIRYELVTCARCKRLIEARPSLRVWAHRRYTEHGEIGSLPNQGDHKEAEAYWKTREKEGARIPQWARSIFLKNRGGSLGRTCQRVRVENEKQALLFNREAEAETEAESKEHACRELAKAYPLDAINEAVKERRQIVQLLEDAKPLEDETED